MLVYFARPIDQAPALDRIANLIEQTLTSIEVSSFRPARAYAVATHANSDLVTVDRINRAALAAADGLVAYLPAGVATLGVPVEIELALSLNKATVILTDQVLLDRSVQIRNWSERGAHVLLVTPDTLASWSARPPVFVDFLLTPPQNEVQFRQGVNPLADLPLMPFVNPGEQTVWQQLDLDKPESELRQPNLSATSFYPNPGAAMHVHLVSGASLPTRGHVGDAGVDLAISESVDVHPGETKLIRTGVTAALPVGWWGLIVGRSSAYAKLGLDVRLGVIDEGYRGELMLRVTNKSGTTRPLVAGQRLAQYVLIPTWQGEVIQTQEKGDLPDPRGRGENGWGSTGE
jgi:dUTP pyrophosphatase